MITVEPFSGPLSKGGVVCSGCYRPSDDLRTIRAEHAAGGITLCPSCRAELRGLLALGETGREAMRKAMEGRR